MTYQQAKNILGSRDTWELNAMIRALTFCELLNTEEDNLRLEAAKVMLKQLRKVRD